MTVETVIAVAMDVVMTIVRDDRRDRDRRGNGRRDDYRKGGRSKDRFDKEKLYRKDTKKPRNTSSEKKTGFVIRNKGDK